MASILIVIVFTVWNIFCICWFAIIPRVIQKLENGGREIIDSEPDERYAPIILGRFFVLASDFWKITARRLIAALAVVIDAFLIISFLQSFH
jgi:hypothetical protein